jgi:hypothetical protein
VTLKIMELKLKIYGCLCATSEFLVNGISADSDDFGDQGDESYEYAEDYACGDMRFTGKQATTEILEKYKINNEEYNEIVSQLEEGLSFGSCGWCV